MHVLGLGFRVVCRVHSCQMSGGSYRLRAPHPAEQGRRCAGRRPGGCWTRGSSRPIDTKPTPTRTVEKQTCRMLDTRLISLASSGGPSSSSSIAPAPAGRSLLPRTRWNLDARHTMVNPQRPRAFRLGHLSQLAPTQPPRRDRWVSLCWSEPASPPSAQYRALCIV